MNHRQPIRILFLADTHLGFDLPFRPRIQRRRRGPEFFDNYHKAIDAAHRCKTDLLVHGGDLFYRSKFPIKLARMASEPLLRLADEGIPIFIVPGNHERSVIPFGHLFSHPNIFIFDRPRTFVQNIRGTRLVLAGYPFVRQHIRPNFKSLTRQTGYTEIDADIRLLCIHQCFEGAGVGPKGYTFRYGADVIKAADLPRNLNAVLTGHIHRHQILTADLNGKPLPAPVLYPGSIERTSFAERHERKGYLILELDRSRPENRHDIRWTFEQLPARPMIQLGLDAAAMTAEELGNWVERSVQEITPDSIVKMMVHGRIGAKQREMLRAASLRRMAPETMNIEAVLVEERRAGHQ